MAETEVMSEPRGNRKKERRELAELRRFDARLKVEAYERWGCLPNVNGPAHRWFGLMSWLNVGGDIEEKVMTVGINLASQAWRDLMRAPVKSVEDVAIKLIVLEQELVEQHAGVRDDYIEAVAMIGSTCICRILPSDLARKRSA